MKGGLSADRLLDGKKVIIETLKKTAALATGVLFAADDTLPVTIIAGYLCNLAQKQGTDSLNLPTAYGQGVIFTKQLYPVHKAIIFSCDISSRRKNWSGRRDRQYRGNPWTGA